MKENIINPCIALIVIVLYKTLPENSATIKTLLKFNHSWTKFRPKVLVYNNSPENNIESTAEYEVVNAKQNDMLAGAYNYALNIANEQNIPWLILLDQDTEINVEYVVEMQDVIEKINGNILKADIIAPRIFNNGLQVSPKIYNPKYHIGFTANPIDGGRIYNNYIASFNSGIALKTSAINDIGGFSYRYLLYGQDYDYLRRLHQNGRSVYVLHVSIKHDMASNSYKKNISKNRYAMIVDSEKRFAKDCGAISLFTYKIWLLMRATKWIFIADKRPYLLLTIKNVFK